MLCICLPGICDAVFHSHANSALECSFTDLATSYVGVVSQTRTGLTCQYWSRQIPHAHALTDDVMFPDQSVEAARNYCRYIIHNPLNPCMLLHVYTGIQVMGISFLLHKI